MSAFIISFILFFFFASFYSFSLENGQCGASVNGGQTSISVRFYDMDIEEMFPSPFRVFSLPNKYYPNSKKNVKKPG